MHRMIPIVILLSLTGAAHAQQGGFIANEDTRCYTWQGGNFSSGAFSKCDTWHVAPPPPAPIPVAVPMAAPPPPIAPMATCAPPPKPVLRHRKPRPKLVC